MTDELQEMLTKIKRIDKLFAIGAISSGGVNFRLKDVRHDVGLYSAIGKLSDEEVTLLDETIRLMKESLK